MNDTGSTLMAHCGARKVTRDELMEIPIPEATKTHQPLSHYGIVEVLEEALSFRGLAVERDEYAVSGDGMKMFGVMDLNNGFGGVGFSIGLRNSNDKSMRLALTAGYRVFVCDNMAFSGDFTPLLHKHTRNLELRDSISIAVDRIYRGFQPMTEGIRAMQRRMLTDNDARLMIYQAFIDGGIKGLPRVLMPSVHGNYFKPEHEAFTPRSMWSLSNAFTSAFKNLTPIKQFEVTARLGSFFSNEQGVLKEKQKEDSVLDTDSFDLEQDEREDMHDLVIINNENHPESGFGISSVENELPDDDRYERIDDELMEEYEQKIAA